MEEVDVEQSDELKAALLLMPEKRYTGTWASNFSTLSQMLTGVARLSRR